MNTDEDPDWEAKRIEGEAEAVRAECWEDVAVYMHKILKSQPLPVKKLPTGTRLVVTNFLEEEDPQNVCPVEFTMLDPASCKVLVKDSKNFTVPTEGTLLGSDENHATTPGKRVLEPGMLKMFSWLIYEVGGKKFDGDTIRGIKIFLPGNTEPYDLWGD
jgi:hypothetical protein